VARIVLLIAAIVEFVFRGLPALFGSEWLAKLFGLEYIPGCLVYVHPFGALMLTFGVMFFLASKDPVKHRLLVDIGILRFGLGALAHIISIVGPAPYATFWLVHLVIDVVLLLLLLISRPKAALAAV
jgi:hypothetical protein